MLSPITVLELADYQDAPRVKSATVPPSRIGDTIQLRFCLRRQKGGRSERLDVDGPYRVRSSTIDTSTHPSKQLLTVEAIERPPAWVAVKKSTPRKLALAVFPRTPIR